VSTPRRARPGRLRFAPAAPHLARTMPWVALVAGCAVGLGLSLVAHQFARPSQSPDSIIRTARVAFAPLVVATAFLTSDPHRNLTATLPAPPWLTTAAHLLFAVPALGLTAWLQLELAGADLRITLPPGSPAQAEHLPWLSLIVEMAAWSALAVAVAAVISRTRWNELAGAVAAPAALALTGVLALAPLGLFPAAATGPGQSASWPGSDWRWCALSLAAVLVACWACRDPWRRLPWRP